MLIPVHAEQRNAEQRSGRQALLPPMLPQGVAGVQYPPGSVEKLVGAVFLAGSTSRSAWLLKLSLLAYWLADGGFLPRTQLAEGFRWGSCHAGALCGAFRGHACGPGCIYRR